MYKYAKLKYIKTHTIQKKLFEFIPVYFGVIQQKIKDIYTFEKLICQDIFA